MLIFGLELFELESFFGKQAIVADHFLIVSFEISLKSELNLEIDFYPHDNLCQFILKNRDEKLIELNFASTGNILLTEKDSIKYLLLNKCICVKDKFYYKYLKNFDYSYSVKVDLNPSFSIKFL